MKNITSLAIIFLAFATFACSISQQVSIKADHAMEILKQQKAEAMQTQDQLRIMLTQTPPRIAEGKNLLSARQRRIQSVKAEVASDQNLYEVDKKDILDVLGTESASLSKQLSMLSSL